MEYVEMKVTVCFGSIRVLVPCGAGDLLVRDLVREAILRYKKAIGQGPESWVGVRALRASSGGILDPDDRVRDVADDRETLTAECARAGSAGHPPPAPCQPRAAPADGASGSSAGTASPDMFRGGGGGGIAVGGSMRVPVTDSCVEVGAGGPPEEGGGLQVRRGSEPALHQDTLHLPQQREVSEPCKRWSAAVVCREDPRHPHQRRSPAASPAPRPPDPSHFQRQANRLSMQFSGPGSGVWLDAADRAQNLGSKSLPRDARREPLGQDTAPARAAGHQNHRVEDMLRWVTGVNSVAGAAAGPHERPLDLLAEVGGSECERAEGSAPQTMAVSLVKGERGLGFTITTRDNPTHGDCPIYIKNILPKGAAVTDGRLRAGDRLVAVDGRSVAGLTQQQVVALLRNTPTHATVEILVERTPAKMQRVEPQLSSHYQEKAVGEERTRSDEVSTTAATSTDAVLREALDSSNSILSLRNRLVLRLDVPVHDSEKAGLGISVKGKVTVGPDPQDLGIFIKSVLHGGAASRDGRLHTNDQLLSVNGVTLVGQSNAEAMEALRRALLHARPHLHGSISLTVARRMDSMDSLTRWKDDTLPEGNDSTIASADRSGSQAYTTVIYNGSTDLDRRDGRANEKLTTSVTINNNSWTSNQSDDSKGDGKRDSFEWGRLDGWNPVIGRLTGLRNESYYMATQADGGAAQHQHHHHQHPAVIIEEDYGTARSSVSGSGAGAGGGGGESGSESGGGGAGAAFSRDAVGRRSMSEKRHAAMDAKQTGTYKKIKEIKAISSMQVGPALGMRKSSSLESLQTALQETQRPPRNEPIYARPHPPLKHWLTDDNSAPDGNLRRSPQQSSLSYKKPSILKSLSSMFRINKPHKKSEQEMYGRSQPGRSSEKFLSREPSGGGGSWTQVGENDSGHAQTPLQRVEVSHERQSAGAGGRRAVAPPYRAPPRTAPAPSSQPQAKAAWAATGHYVNYEEIQQNLNARREKLSEVQIGQMRRQAHAHSASQRDGDIRQGRASEGLQQSRPQSNYYEYESVPPRRPGKLSHYH